ncbi:MAG: SufD family Fe-S cluster assembly protein [Bacteroidales bacterium]|nr:SufD family Fe-S cluster assembly protein [Bacteroidales bacterium]MDE6146715.1 SufD family Fe-S cluster assembly protein [Bacteroidales bacterium]
MTACDAMDVHNTVTVPAGQSFNKIYIAGNEEALPGKIVVEKDAKAEIVILSMPGTEYECSLEVVLAGRGASADIAGAYVCGHDEKIRISVDMRHEVPDCTSRQLFKGIAGGHSSVDFYGKITVVKDAQHTEAYQENHNILISDYAKVNTKPQLEIYADDVKCSHGATIGRLNEEEQFYMRSRGISLEDARVLQMISFLSPVLGTISDPELHGQKTAELEEAVRSIVKAI